MCPTTAQLTVVVLTKFLNLILVARRLERLARIENLHQQVVVRDAVLLGNVLSVLLELERKSVQLVIQVAFSTSSTSTARASTSCSTSLPTI